MGTMWCLYDLTPSGWWKMDALSMDFASNWLERLPAGSISTSEDLTARFLAQFFPPRRTVKLRNDILMFQQHQAPQGALLIKRPVIVLSTSDRRLIELENQVQCLVEAHLAPNQPVQVNKIASSCEICGGSHDTQYCMENPKQAFVDYATSHNNEMGGKLFTTNQGPRIFNEATNAWKDKPKFNWAQTQTFASPQKGSFSTYSSNMPYRPSSYQTKLERVLNDFNSHQEKRLSSLRTQLKQQEDDVINKINTLWKVVSERFDNASTYDIANDSMAHDEPKEPRTLDDDATKGVDRNLDTANKNTLEKEPRAPMIIVEEVESSSKGDGNETSDLGKEDVIEKEGEWVDVEQPLDLVNVYEDSVYKSLIEKMPSCLLNFDFRIEKGNPSNLKIACMIVYPGTPKEKHSLIISAKLARAKPGMHSREAVMSKDRSGPESLVPCRGSRT
ncbi:MAK10-like protein [Tanacetum coccineum]|uniref:MAK10-like protein n=1 Tax=Tanacetum coccineum TaxID=301880 RepID=A0ABQ5BTJ4_9ASTR